MRLALLPLALVLPLASCSSMILRSQVEGAESVEPTEARVTLNGGFTITSNLAKGQLAGDGQDEQTTWQFRFHDAKRLQRILAAQAPLQRAELTLHIKLNGETNGELLLMEDSKLLFRIALEELFPNLPEGERFKTSASLPLDALNEDGDSLGELIDMRVRAGQPLELRYGDDASISYAKLCLDYE